jgi:hypothetical protein
MEERQRVSAARAPCRPITVIGFAARRDGGARAEQHGGLGLVASPCAATSPLTRVLRDVTLSPDAADKREGSYGEDCEAARAGGASAGERELHATCSGASGSSSSDEADARAPEEGHAGRHSLAGSVPVCIPGDRRRCVPARGSPRRRPSRAAAGAHTRAWRPGCRARRASTRQPRAGCADRRACDRRRAKSAQPFPPVCLHVLGSP